MSAFGPGGAGGVGAGGGDSRNSGTGGGQSGNGGNGRTSGSSASVRNQTTGTVQTAAKVTADPVSVKAAQQGRSVFGSLSTKSPTPNITPGKIALPAPPPGQVGDYNPDYNWSDTDRVFQAGAMALDVATGSMVGLAADAIGTETGLTSKIARALGFSGGPMTAPRGYSKIGTRADNGAERGTILPQIQLAAPSVVHTPAAVAVDKFFSFFNPGA